jgi:diacylglycerol kinase family enzyme
MRTLVIINTRSGGGDAGLYDYVRALGSTGTEVTLRFCDGTRRLEDLVLDAGAFERVVAAGGDGTVSAVAYALRDTGIPVLVYPAGTANLLALNLGMPTEPRALADITMSGVPVRFDVGEVVHAHPADGGDSHTGFMVMAGAGYDASLIEAAGPMKSNLGAAAYLFAAMGNLAPTAARFRLDLDGRRLETDGIAVLVVNFGRLQFDIEVARGADPRDGVFDVAVLRSRNAAGLVPAVLAGIFDRAGGRDAVPGIDVYSAGSVSVDADPALRMQYDGEAVDAITPFQARVLPRAATLLLPADSPFAR